MNSRFELVRDEHDRICFRLLDTEGQPLLTGLPCSGKIAAQNEVLHARNSIRAERFVTHEEDGAHFVVLKDKDGSVLAKSPRVETTTELDHLVAAIQQHCGATIVDHTGPRYGRTAG